MLRPGATARTCASGGVTSASSTSRRRQPCGRTPPRTSAATRSPAASPGGTAQESGSGVGNSAPTSTTATTSSAPGRRWRYCANVSSASRSSRFTLADFGLLASSRRATTTPSARTSANRRSRAVGASGTVADMGRLAEVDTCIYARSRTKSRGVRENCPVFISPPRRPTAGRRCGGATPVVTGERSERNPRTPRELATSPGRTTVRGVPRVALARHQTLRRVMGRS